MNDAGDKLLSDAMQGADSIFSDASKRRKTPDGARDSDNGSAEDIIQRALQAYGSVFAKEISQQSAP